MSTVEQRAALEMMRGYFSEEDGEVQGRAATLIAWVEELWAENIVLKAKLKESQAEYEDLIGDTINRPPIRVRNINLRLIYRGNNEPSIIVDGADDLAIWTVDRPDEPERLVPSPGSHSVVF